MKEINDLISKSKHIDNYELEKNFDLAYNDDTFKKIVSKLKCPREMLIKYTSLIEDSAREVKN